MEVIQAAIGKYEAYDASLARHIVKNDLGQFYNGTMANDMFGMLQAYSENYEADADALRTPFGGLLKDID